MEDIELICTKYYKYVKGYALSLCFNESLAEDITQETFYKAINSYSTFKGECRIETWLCRIARNLFLNSKRAGKTENIDDYLQLSSKLCVEDDAVKNDEINRILAVSLLIESPYKEVFYMKVLGDFSYAVIAEVFNKSESWARVTYFRAKQKIIERMNKDA